MDVIFGTYNNDELKLVHHRANRRGLQHRHALSPADPKPNEPVTLSVWLGTDTSFDHVVCYYTTGKEQPNGSFGVSGSALVAPFVERDTVWDTINWGICHAGK